MEPCQQHFDTPRVFQRTERGQGIAVASDIMPTLAETADYPFQARSIVDDDNTRRHSQPPANQFCKENVWTTSAATGSLPKRSSIGPKGHPTVSP
jgi:hypothetical protein